MPHALRQILVTFPVDVALTREEETSLHDLIGAICKRVKAENPGRVVWVGGYGSMVTSMPITAEDDRNGVPLEFDDSTLHLEVIERADYDWPCSLCGHKQGDHQGHILNPPAGDCAFAPAGKGTA